MAVINGNVPPINPMEPKKCHLYIYNNLFFSFALDGRDVFKDVGGDSAAYRSVNNDLLGVRAFNTVDVDKLYTVATAIVDYRGYRVVAQSIIPGLFTGLLQNESATIVSYGSIDNKEIKSDKSFHELMKTAADRLHLKEHLVSDEKGEKHLISGPVDAKGIKGSDGRRYILDLVRTTPRDANYPNNNHQTFLLRHELIQQFIASLVVRLLLLDCFVLVFFHWELREGVTW